MIQWKYKKLDNCGRIDMLGKLELKIKAQEKLGYQMSSLFHGALMELLPADYADYMHVSQLHPYTQHLEYREGEWYWVICCLNKEAVKIIIQDTLWNITTSIEQVMGYEGTAAKIYFKVIGTLIEPEFSFKGRSKRPPLDPFNSMISLGYSIIMNELYGKIEGKGLNPYFGIMHKDREKHPTLASDLMEEWRAVLIDSTVLSMINGHEIGKEEFYTSVEQPGVFLEKEALRKYIKKLETKFRTESKYLTYIDYRVSFRQALDLQIGQFIKAIETENPEVYTPIVIR